MTKRGFKTTEHHNKPTKAPAAKPIAPAQTSWTLLRQSPKMFWDNFVPAFMVVVLPTTLLQLGVLLVGDRADINVWTVTGVGLQLIAFPLLILNISASPYLQVYSLRNQRVGVWQMYRQGLQFWLRIVGFSLLFALLFAIGLLLLIVPGLIALRRYTMTPFYIVEDNLGIREAMQRSAAASKPDRLYIWTTIGVLVACAGIGLGITRLPEPWSPLLNGIFPVFYFYLLGLRYRDSRRNLLNDGASSTLR